MKRIIVYSLLAVLLGGAGTAAAQLAPVDEPAVCYQCHGDVEKLGTKKHVHTAFEGGVCSECHNPHASKHASLLVDAEAGLCVSCHEDIADELALTSAHKPAADGSCGRCHHPHASDFPAQLNKEASALCQDCHANSLGWESMASVHAPVAEGECLTCHAKHGSQNDNLLSSKVPDLCFDCHDPDQDFLSVHKGYDLSQADCATCHDPHASGMASLLRPNQHSPFKGGNCKSCHGSGTGPDAFVIKGGVTDLCYKCHRAIKNDNMELAYHGHLEGDKSCSNCHNPHTSSAEFLLAADQSVLCLRCHFNDPQHKNREAYLTHDAMDCSMCHAPHGADNESYLKTLDVDLCVECHGAAHATSHPVGEGVIDARTGQELTCLTCHQLHDPPFEQYLPLDPAMDLCIQCHKK